MHKLIKATILFLLCAIANGQTINLSDSDIKSFPTAEGFGKNTNGWREYASNVYFVTNTDSGTGPGSFGAAVNSAISAGGGVIIFRTSGYIDLLTNQNVGANTYVAGQTSPNGICFRAGATGTAKTFWVENGEVVLRYLQFRPGDNAISSDDALKFRIGSSSNLNNLMVDHVSASWGKDENLSFENTGTGYVTNVTVQYSMFYEVFGAGNGLLTDVQNLSVYKNYLSNSNSRNFITGDCNTSYEFVNNIVYNFNYGTNTGWGSDIDVIGNIYKNKPGTAVRYPLSLQDPGANCAEYTPTVDDTFVYDSGNIFDVDSYVSGFSDRQQAWIDRTQAGRQVTGSGITPDVITGDSGAALIAELITNSGAGASLWANSLDEGQRTDFNAGTGAWISSQADSYPPISAGTPYTDIDLDGIDDAWEDLQAGGDVTASTRPVTAQLYDGTTVNQSGVTNYATTGYTYMDIFLSDLAGDWDSFTPAPPTGQTITLSESDIKAFPTATGHGRFTTGGRGQNVYRVTNLNDSGTGSFRAAMDAADANGGGIIIFTVGGTIVAPAGGTYQWDNTDNITIAGQTAPGDGVALYGAGLECDDCDNVIVRHMRFRVGDPGNNATDDDALSFSGTDETISDIIIDHVSASWSWDENLSITGEEVLGVSRRFTVQNSIISEPFDEPFGALLRYSIDSLSVIGNIFAHNRERNPGAYSEVEIINNVIYNAYEGINTWSDDDVSIIGNVLKGGPTYNFVGFDIGQTNGPVDPNGLQATSYFNDNITNGSASTPSSGYENGTASPTRLFPSDYEPIPSSQVLDHVASSAGARNGISGLDALDSHIVQDVINGTGNGSVSSEAQTNGLPTLSSGTPYLDEDLDGLSDAYELAQGGTNIAVNPSTRPATATLTDGTTIIDQSGVTNYQTTGYTHMDIFLAELAGDWDSFTPGPGGGGTPTPPGTKTQTAQLILRN